MSGRMIIRPYYIDDTFYFLKFYGIYYLPKLWNATASIK